MSRFSAVITFSLFLSLIIPVQGSDTQLSIGTWGGPYEDAQREVLFAPFELKSGTQVLTQEYYGGLDELRAKAPADLFDMLEEEALTACEDGLLLKLDSNLFVGTDTNSDFDNQDFLKGAISTCAIAHLTFSTLVAFDERAFPGEKPQTIADLFNIVRFPGKRALKKEPSAILEWALMAEGVPNSQVYNLLSTERGMRIALKRLDAIREHIIWWDKPGDAVTLLEQGDVVMASGYNGRFFDSWRLGTPINMIWDGQIIDRSVWAISAKNPKNATAAHEFIRFALQPERQAKIAERIPYGPTDKSAFRFIGLHPEAGISMTDHLPTTAHHLENALFRDTRWYARTNNFRRKHFTLWLDGEG